MSLNYSFAIDSDLSLEEFVRKFALSLEEKSEITVESSYVNFFTDAFNGTFSLADEDDKEANEQVYGIRNTIKATIREYKAKRQESIRAIFRFVNQVIHNIEGDFIFEFNGEFPVVIRKGGHVQINHEFDDGTHIPFDEIKGPVEIVRMKVQ